MRNNPENRLLQKNLIMLLAIFYGSCSYATNAKQSQLNGYCVKGSQWQLLRSQELQALAKADQEDRNNRQLVSEKNLTKLMRNDLARRKKVGEIFAEGCFQNAKDYMAAALIYQHGNSSDHYYQAFIWSKRASELGDLRGRSSSALAIDRYLISLGKKQLFGSQYQKKLPSDFCYCMPPVEQSFPDTIRVEYSGRSLKENYGIMASINGKNCPKIERPASLQPTLKGSVIGLW